MQVKRGRIKCILEKDLRKESKKFIRTQREAACGVVSRSESAWLRSRDRQCPRACAKDVPLCGRSAFLSSLAWRRRVYRPSNIHAQVACMRACVSCCIVDSIESHIRVALIASFTVPVRYTSGDVPRGIYRREYEIYQLVSETASKEEGEVESGRAIRGIARELREKDKASRAIVAVCSYLAVSFRVCFFMDSIRVVRGVHVDKSMKYARTMPLVITFKCIRCVERRCDLLLCLPNGNALIRTGKTG